MYSCLNYIVILLKKDNITSHNRKYEPISCLNDLDFGGIFEKQIMCYIWRT